MSTKKATCERCGREFVDDTAPVKEDINKRPKYTAETKLLIHQNGEQGYGDETITCPPRFVVSGKSRIRKNEYINAMTAARNMWRQSGKPARIFDSVDGRVVAIIGKYAAVILIVLSLASPVEARWRVRRVSSNCQPVTAKQVQAPQVQGPIQAQCQAKANELARRCLLSHNVGPIIGAFEGIGCCGIGGVPGTCVPSSRMRCAGDASAVGRNGLVYRVRAWVW